MTRTMRKEVCALVFSAIAFAALPSQGQVVEDMTNTVPWWCGFEETDCETVPNCSFGYTNGMLLVDGIGGWHAIPGDARVQTDIISDIPSSVFTVTKMAAAIGENVTLSNRFAAHSVTSVWVQMDARASLNTDGEPPKVDMSSTALFFINSNGHFVVHDSGVPGVTNWVTNTVSITGDPVQYVENEWVRLNLFLDYEAARWALFADYNLIATNISFVDTNMTDFFGFVLDNQGNATSALDNVSVTFDSPPDLSETGGNWLPDLQVSETEYTVEIFEGQTAGSWSYEIWKGNENYYDLVFSNSPSRGWLQATPVFGTNDGSSNTVMEVTFDDLPAGVHEAAIEIFGWDSEFGFAAVNAPRTIDVTIVVKRVPVVAVWPEFLVNEVSEGYNAGGQSFDVWNASEPQREPMEYAVTSNVPWITAAPDADTWLDNTNRVDLSYSTETLEPGFHSGTVTVASSGYGASTSQVAVEMRVNARPVLEVSEPGWSNTIARGETWEPVTFEVSNSSIEPRGRMRYRLSVREMGWAILSHLDGTLEEGEEDEVTVTFETDGLLPGVYTGAIVVEAFDDSTGDAAVDSPNELKVRLVVGPGAVLETTLRTLRQEVLQDSCHTDTFEIWNVGGEPWGEMDFTVSKDVEWLEIRPSAGRTATDERHTVEVVLSAGGLSPGTYSDTITVDARDVNMDIRTPGAPRSAKVTLIVAARKPVNFEPPEIRGVPQVGQVLEAYEGLWQRRDRLEFSYQWQRAGTIAGHDLEDIPGAVGRTYTVTEEDRASWLRVRVTAVDAEPTPLSTTVYSEFSSSARVRVVPGDFCGDGLTDLWFFDAESGVWRVAFSKGGAGELQFGWSGTIPVPGDYTGNGLLDVAIYDPAEGTWYALLRPSFELATLRFGAWDMEPVPGDYSGDGATDVALYWPAGGAWYILSASAPWKIDYRELGGPEAVPVPADYSGDGVTDLAVYWPETGTWFISSGDSGEYRTEKLGGNKALPVPGDYDGDGKADIAVYWYEDNRWEAILSSTGEHVQGGFGTSRGDGIPVPGYYDFDSLLDPATLHLRDGFAVWGILHSMGEDGYRYRGHSYEFDINMWRVSR